jgi:hypothetical protein
MSSAARYALAALLGGSGTAVSPALSEVDALYANNVVPLRAAADPDANPTQSASEPA